MHQKIPSPLYAQILEHIPIPCVDFVLVQNNKVLLTYRTEQPAKDQWWIQGGRIHKNETLHQAIYRLAEREIGTRNIKIIKKIGGYEFFSNFAPLTEVTTGIHDIAIVFLVEPLELNFQPTLDNTHKNIKWIDHIEESLDPYIKTILKDAHIF